MDSDESRNDEDLLIQREFITLGTEDVAPQTEGANNLHPIVMQQLKQPRCKSSVWIYFQRLDTTLAKCRICHGNYRFGSSISNLRHHAEVKHGEVLKLGPVKFLEQLKVPKEQLEKYVHSSRSSQKKSKIIREGHFKATRRRVMPQLEIKIEPTQITETEASGIVDEEIQKTLESIYEKGDENINSYMESPSSNTSYQNNEYTNNNEDEQAIDCVEEYVISNPLNPVKSGHSATKLQRMKEDRMRAETNYFNKKAAYMERSAEYVEAQKQHVLLQSQKLKMEIAAMKEGLLHS